MRHAKTHKYSHATKAGTLDGNRQAICIEGGRKSFKEEREGTELEREREKTRQTNKADNQGYDGFLALME